MTKYIFIFFFITPQQGPLNVISCLPYYITAHYKTLGCQENSNNKTVEVA